MSLAVTRVVPSPRHASDCRLARVSERACETTVVDAGEDPAAPVAELEANPSPGELRIP